MMLGKICIDTNIAIDILNGNAKILKFLDTYESILLPITVIGELRFGAYRSAKKSADLVKIDALEMRCEIIEIGSSVADQKPKNRLQRLRTIPCRNSISPRNFFA